MNPIRLFTDGASRGNPGPAAIGYRILDERGSVLKQDARCIGHATNNVAEYGALLFGLEAAAQLTSDEIAWASDSELVVQQMKGEWQVKKPHLKRLHERASAAVRAFRNVSMEHRPRTDPHIAEVDALINRALDDGGGQRGPAGVPRRTGRVDRARRVGHEDEE